MKKLTFKQWIAVTICIVVPAFLMYQNHNTTLFSMAVLSYVVIGVIEELKKRKVTTWAPLVGYITMIIYMSVKIVMSDKVFYRQQTEILVNVVKYGAILLLAIPLLYYNKDDN